MDRRRGKNGGGLTGRGAYGRLLGRRRPSAVFAIATTCHHWKDGSRPRLNVTQTFCMASPLNGHAPHYRMHSEPLRSQRCDLCWSLKDWQRKERKEWGVE